MPRFTLAVAALPPLALALALGACADVPEGPTVAAMPGTGKSFDAFAQDDAGCRQYAAQTGVPPGQAAANSAVGSAAVGTALGAATGALIGAAGGAAGVGAAVGAGAGLLTGAAVGGANAQYAGATAQQRYDTAYAQCMFGHGNTVTQAEAPAAYPGPYGYAPGYYPPSYYGPAYVGAPVVVGGPTIAFGVGPGYYYRGGWYRRPYWWR
jgi:hypothetical protein